ncbi:MAG TPA: hypothetical protein VFT13_11805 [Candidatus Krumholzibacteria bacterium]|nr:hypothetical protein [Candidatus Krumholzibacteria bacterium]
MRVTLDSLTVRISGPDGSFDFGAVEAGSHVLVFEHISFLRRELAFEWPRPGLPPFVELEAAQFTVDPIEVAGAREVPALPVSAVTFDRELATLTAGNIANDPLRTVQSHPSAATAGIDFLSTMAIRGGDTEEFRVNATAFVDLVNLLNRRNVSTTYALEVSPGEFTTVPYGGTRFFPIGGITIWW